MPDNWIIWLAIALIGGLLRVIDGRGKEWVAFPGAVRSGILFFWGIVAAFYAFEFHWITLWVGGFVGYALVRGFPDGAWQSWLKMLIHYGTPCVLAVAPLVAGVYPIADTWPLWFVPVSVVAAYYYVKNVYFSSVGGWWAYLTEFLAGAALYGGIALL